jgi:hypothetical protein
MRRTSLITILVFVAGLGIGYFARGAVGTLQQRYTHKADLAAIEKLHEDAFRRFRQAVLEKSEVRQLLIDFWLGHDNPDMSSGYAKQLTEDVEFRQEWAEKVGLGFVMPDISDTDTRLSCATCATNSVEHVCVADA